MGKIEHEAAWQRQPGLPLEIATVETPEPEAGQILVRNAAIAINPVDILLQDEALFPWVSYPMILGSDVAGVVEAVGRGVERFKVGDRVMGQALGVALNQPAQSAFQTHTLVFVHMAAPLPSQMSFTDAAVLPLGLGTAASGMFQKTNLALRLPDREPAHAGQTVIVWGASSSVGCNAVQLAGVAGYDCVAVAGRSGFELVKGLGAGRVFDHSDPDVVEKVVEALRGKNLAGALHATGDMAATFAAVARCDGRRFVATTLLPAVPVPEGVETNHIHGTSLKDDEVSQAIYGEFLGPALEDGRFRASPPPRVVGRGLVSLQAALDAWRGGVSGEKVVVAVDRVPTRGVGSMARPS